jgi:hypothetical protein
MDQKQLATVPHDLLEDIEKLYPERTPDPHMTDREIWMAVGRRQVVGTSDPSTKINRKTLWRASMCLNSGSDVPEPKAPAPPPPPPTGGAAAMQGSPETSQAKGKKKRGRNKLRIDLKSNPQGKSGLNIPSN